MDGVEFTDSVLESFGGNIASAFRMLELSPRGNMSELPSVADEQRLLLAGVALPARSFTALPLPATATELAQFLAVRAAACVGADYSNVATIGGDGAVLRVHHGTSLAPAIADRYIDVPVTADFPIAAAARDGAAVMLRDLDSYRAHFPAIVADTVAAGIQATASLPLFREDGTVVGAIGFAWSVPTEFDDRLRSALRAVVELCTAAIERAERFDADHRFIVELSASLLSALPAMAGLDTSARYLPASETSSVGGDWYEGLRLDATRFAVVVGDVAGHGLAAAADMALLRGMITALLHSGVDVADVFGEVAGVLDQRVGLILASAALVVIDLAAASVTYATAGHPPPLVHLPDGTVRRLDAANMSMIGLPAKRVTATMPFPLGSTLVVFTDGLVERRDRDVDSGIDQVAAELSSLPHGHTAHGVTDGVVAALLGGNPAEDDVAIVVVRHVAEQAGAG